MHNFYIEHERMGKRWKLRRIRTGQEKHLRRTLKERNHITDEIRNLGYIQLEHPISAGYKRLFMLTYETGRLKNRDFYQGILNKINTIRYSSTKQFETKRTSRKYKRRKRKKKEQRLLEPEHSSRTFKLFSKEELNYFYEIKYYCGNCKKYHIKYVFSEPWRFILRIRPHFITKVKRKDSILEQREAELSDWLDQHHNQGWLRKIVWSRKSSWSKFQKQYDTKQKYRDFTLKNKPLHEIEADYQNEKNYGNTT